MRRTMSIGTLAAMVCAVGTAEAFRFPRAGASFGAGTAVEAAWDAPCDLGREDEGELVLSVDDGATFPIRLTGEMPACISGHVWRVPDVATSRARLGLRRGRDGEPGEERVVLVSARFAIVGGAASVGAGLTRGAAEWWSHAALEEFDAEDFLDESLGREARWYERRASPDEVENPGPGVLRVRALPRTGLLSVPLPRASSRREVVTRILLTLPLRL